MSEKRSADEWTLSYARRAEKDIDRLDPRVRRRVLAALGQLAGDPRRSGTLRKLTAAPESRLRIGDWRALITLDEKTRTINVARVLPRGRPYDR
jgi:mRNA interferase RelE/StbE